MRILYQPGLARVAEATSAPVSETGCVAHQALRAWELCQPGAPRPERVEILKFQTGKKRIVYRLCGAGPEGAPIIAKRCQAEKAHVERLIYEEVLPAIGQEPRLHLHGFVTDPDDETYCWLFLEEAEGSLYSPSDEGHRALAARWLGQLHLANLPAGIRARLPNRSPAYFLQVLRDDRRILLEHLAHNPALPGAWAGVFTRTLCHLDALEAQWSMMEQICGTIPQALVHGDFAKKNLRVREAADGAELRVFDWELAGWGAPAVDLAQIVHKVANPDLDAYCAFRQHAHPRLNLANLQGIAACGNLFRLVKEVKWTMALAEFGSRDSLIKPLAYLEIFDHEFEKAIEILKGVLA